MRVLLLGSTGLLGKDLEQSLLRYGHDVIAPDRFTLQDRFSVLDYDWMRDEVYNADKANRLARMISEYDAEAVINSIAYVNADKAEKEQREATIINTNLPAMLSKACQWMGSTLLHVSTDYVFGNQVTPYMRAEFGINSFRTEESQTQPMNVYGATKAQGDKWVSMTCDKHYILRTSWLYGAGKPNWLDLAFEGRYFDLYANTFGSPTYTHDAAEAMVNLLDSKAPYGIYNVANDTLKPRTKFEIMHYAIYKSQKDIRMQEYKADKLVAKRPLNTALSVEKIKPYYEMPSVFDAVDRYMKQKGYM